MVLRGLGRDRLSGAQARGFHEPPISRFFRHHRNQHLVYHPLNAEHCRQWIARVSANPRFLFTAKLWQKFTHEQDAGDEDERAVRSGFDVLRDAGKLGAVLLQFPFSFHRSEENTSYLKNFSSDLPIIHWCGGAPRYLDDKAFYAMLHERGVGFCNIDQPVIGRSMKPSERSTARVAYVRLHGRRYDSWFSDDPPCRLRSATTISTRSRSWSLGCAHPPPGRGGRLHIRRHQQSFSGKGNRECAAIDPSAHWRESQSSRAASAPLSELERIASEPPAEPLLFQTYEKPPVSIQLRECGFQDLARLLGVFYR